MHFQDLKIQIAPLCQKYKITQLDVFGSFARGDANSESDLDIMVVFDGQENLFDRYMGLMKDLSELSKRKVDLLTYNSVANPIFKRVIDREKKNLWMKRY